MVGGVLLVISLESQTALSWHAVVPSPQRDENTAFFSSFPLAESIAKAFFRLFLWKFKEKASTVFMLQPFKKASAVFYGTAQITRGFWGKYSEADAIQKAGDVPEPGCSGGGPEVGADSLLLPGRKRGAFPMASSRVLSLRWLCVLSSPPSLQHSHDGKKRGPLPASLCTPPTFSLSICALRQKPRSAIAHVKRDGLRPFGVNKLYPRAAVSPLFFLCAASRCIFFAHNRT
ncbi:hypothetical protein [uncultured Bilophila sp.]|uniref:hypothetical protein n=1 Tax=uncultured Bilophila sp. TaxID=529385 RepID=UPI00280BD8D6|nr:hypothetical protein [uncultured Bilophila sp.]